MALTVGVQSQIVTLFPTTEQTFLVTAPVGNKILSVGYFVANSAENFKTPNVLKWKRPLSDVQWEVRLDGSSISAATSVTLYCTYTS